MAALLALAGCKPLPDSQVAKDEREFAWVRAADGTRQCLVEKSADDDSLVTKGESAEPCMRFLPPKRWKGIWHEEEHWYFCEAIGDECKRADPYLLVWRAPSPSALRSGTQRKVKIEFIGRRTKEAAERMFGWPNSHAILVERIVRAEPMKSEEKAKE